MKNCFLMLSRLKIHSILFLDRLRRGAQHVSSTCNSNNDCARGMQVGPFVCLYVCLDA